MVRRPESQKKWFLAYFYQPQWIFQDLPMARVKLPDYTVGCDTVPAKVACDYPPYELNKVASVKFAGSGSPAVSLAKKFQWTNDDQNEVAEYIANEHLTDDQAAKKWVDAHQSVWQAWIPQ